MKKILSIVLITILTVNFAVNCFAYEVSSNRIYSEDIESVSSGETVRIPVRIGNNTGMMGFKIFVVYDESVFTPVSIERGDVTASGLLNDNIDSNAEDGLFYVVWTNSSNVASDGVLFYMSFTVKNTTESNTEVAFTYSQDDTFDENWDDVFLNCDYFSIGVSGGSGYDPEEPPIDDPEDPDGKATVLSDRIFAFTDTEVDVPIYIKDNTGIMGYKLIFDYNPNYIQPLSIIPATGINGAIDDNIGLKSGTFSVVWNSTENYIGTGELFTIRFSLKNQSRTRIDISYSQDDTFNENWEDVELSCIPIEVIDYDILSADAETRINYNKYIIDKLDTELTSLESYIVSTEGFSYTVENLYDFVGTDSKIITRDENENQVHEYSALVYGDVDGDGLTNGMDSIILNCIKNDLLTKNDIVETICMAADCNHDKIIDGDDISLLEQAGLYYDTIIQNYKDK